MLAVTLTRMLLSIVHNRYWFIFVLRLNVQKYYQDKFKHDIILFLTLWLFSCGFVVNVGFYQCTRKLDNVVTLSETVFEWFLFGVYA